jgi:RND family efflux transporter MFP subunit
MVSMRWVGGITGALIAAGLILLATRLQAGGGLEPPAPRRLERGGAQQPREPRGRDYLGVIVAEESADISSRLEARLERLHVQVGDAVKQGAVLATLEAKALERELAVAEAEQLSARADLQVAELALSEAEARLKRREAPQQLALGAISEEELATARYEQRLAAARREGAQARVLEREARVAQLKQHLADATVRAPFDGLVASRYVDPGALVRPGQPLVHLLRAGIPQVRFAVPEEDARRVLRGLPVQVRVPETGLVLAGQVAHVAPEVDAASRMVHAIAQLEGPQMPPHVPSGTVVRVAVVPGAGDGGGALMLGVNRP